MKIVPMRGDYRGLAGVPLNRKHWHGWWAVRQRRSPAKTVGRKSLASSTLAPSASRSAVIGHGIGPGIQSAKKRVGSAWRNAVGHTCPMRSRTFLLGVTAAHGSLEPIVLVRNQEEELSGSTQAAKRRHALVAQWIERPSPERKATSPILVEGTHENSANHNARSPSSLLSQTVAPRTARASRGNALVAQRIERRFPKPGAAGPTPAMGTMPC